MIDKLKYITERALLFPKNEPRLSFWDELHLCVTDITGTSEADYIRAMSEHSEFCREVAKVSKFPVGRVIKDLDLIGGEGLVFGQQISSWISPPKDPELLGDRLIIKPKGNYAVILHQGGMDTIAASHASLIKFIETNRLQILSPIFELDMNTYLMSKSKEDYLIHISVLVE